MTKFICVVLGVLLLGCGYLNIYSSCDDECAYDEFIFHGGPSCNEELIAATREGDFKIPLPVSSILYYRDLGVFFGVLDRDGYYVSSSLVYFKNTDVHEVSDNENFYSEEYRCNEGFYFVPRRHSQVGVGDEAVFYDSLIQIGDDVVAIGGATVFMIEHMFGGLERFKDCSFMVELEKRRPEYR